MDRQIIKNVDELASGLVNGVNKTYTVTKPIYEVEMVKVNSVEYAQYSFAGSSLVLDDAPTTGTVEVTYTYVLNDSFNDNSSWIVGETLQGEIDGNNKVFTSFYPISLIDEVRVDGTPTGAYTFLGNSILLTTAPTTGVVTMDYFRADYGIEDGQRDSYYTRKEIRDLIYVSIGQDDTSEQFPSELVDTAIKSSLSKIGTFITDKTRNISFSFLNGVNDAKLIENSITTIDVAYSEAIPNKGKMLLANGTIVDYSGVNGNTVSLSRTTRALRQDEGVVDAYVGIKLPRNTKRVKGVSQNGALTECGDILSFINYSQGSYLLLSGYLFVKTEGEVQVEIETKNSSDEDGSIVFVEKDDVFVIIDYALARLYRERESDKYGNAMESALQAIKDYKASIRSKRAKDTHQVIKTVPFGTPTQQFIKPSFRSRTVTRIERGDLDGGTATS